MNPCAIVNALYNLQIIIIITGYFSVNIRAVATFDVVVAVVVVVVVTGRMPTGVYQVLFAMPVVVVSVVVVAIAYTCLTSTQLAA